MGNQETWITFRETGIHFWKTRSPIGKWGYIFGKLVSYNMPKSKYRSQKRNEKKKKTKFTVPLEYLLGFAVCLQIVPYSLTDVSCYFSKMSMADQSTYEQTEVAPPITGNWAMIMLPHYRLARPRRTRLPVRGWAPSLSFSREGLTAQRRHPF